MKTIDYLPETIPSLYQISRSIVNPNADPLLAENTQEELIFELRKRPHLYSINCEGKISNNHSAPMGCTHGLKLLIYICSDSVSLLNREPIDRLLKCLDTRAQWTIDTLTIALGEGKAGEEWKGQLTKTVDTVT